MNDNFRKTNSHEEQASNHLPARVVCAAPKNKTQTQTDQDIRTEIVLAGLPDDPLWLASV